MKTSKKQIRAVGYCRTSGEGQRDNTSIDNQKKSTKAFIEREGWQFVGYFTDECKSGKSVTGRTNFLKMIQNAENGEIDIIVPFDIDRFARDGLDILNYAAKLKQNHGVYIVDTKRKFDNRSYAKNFMNQIQAALTEEERLKIMGRMLDGRKARAAKGQKWTSKVPFGRSWSEEEKTFVINEDGRKIQKLLPRYIRGESLKNLAVEFGFSSGTLITRAVRESQLSGTYYATFNYPDIDVIDEKVAVPNMPEIISPALEKKVRSCFANNKRNNKQYAKKYELSGFVRCFHCGEALKPQLQSSGKNGNQILYYRHSYKTYYADDRDKQNKCTHFRSIKADLLKKSVLDFLYSWFVDRPAFEEAVKNMMPNDNDRKALLADINEAEKQIQKLDKSELALVKALSSGLTKTDVLINEQNNIINQRQILKNRLNELRQTYNNMPDYEKIKKDAEVLRWSLLHKHMDKKWQDLGYTEIRQFLQFLFSENPKKNDFGIFVGREGGQWEIKFKGQVEFSHNVVDGEPEFLESLSSKDIEGITAKLKDKKDVAKKANDYQKIKNEVERLESLISEVERLQKIKNDAKQLKSNILPKQRNSLRT